MKDRYKHIKFEYAAKYPDKRVNTILCPSAYNPQIPNGLNVRYIVKRIC